MTSLIFSRIHGEDCRLLSDNDCNACVLASTTLGPLKVLGTLLYTHREPGVGGVSSWGSQALLYGEPAAWVGD